MKKRIALLFACVACSAFAQDPSASCVEELRGNPKLQVLSGKVQLDISNGQPLEVLSNASKPNGKENAALSFLVDELHRCTVVGAAWRTQNYPPKFNSTYGAYTIEFDSMIADLYAGKTTFGQFAKARAVQYGLLVTNLTAIAEEAKAQRDASLLEKELANKQGDERRAATAQQQNFERQQAVEQQAAALDAQRRQAGLQMLINMQSRPLPGYQVQAPPVLNGGVTTNCIKNGMQINCISR